MPKNAKMKTFKQLMRLFLCGKTSRKANFAKDKVAMALFLIMISRTEGY